MSVSKASSNTGHLFARKPPSPKLGLTRERLDADLVAFQEAGGVIEKLGTTRTLKTLGPLDPVHASPMPSTGRANGAKPAKATRD